MNPGVSVIIPAYNAEATLSRAVRSAAGAAGRGPVEEVIIVNDGSVDATPRIADELARAHGGVRVVHQANRGLAAARNAGLDASRGQLVLFLDADDELLPGGAAVLASALEASGAGLAVGGFVVRDRAGGVIARHRAPADLSLNALLALPMIIVPAVLMRREIATAYRFDPLRARVEDYDLWFRLAGDGVLMTPVEAEVCAYEVRPGTMSTDYEGMLAHGVEVIEAAFARARGGRGVDASDERRRRVVGSLVHAWAARAAAAGEPDRARRLAQRCPEGFVLTPDVAAGHAIAAVRMGLARRLEFPLAAPEWVAPLAAWWSELEARGVTDGPEMALRTLRAIPERAIEPAGVAEAVLDRLAPGTRSIVIQGSRGNAAALRRAAAARGLGVGAGPVIATDSDSPGTADIRWYDVRAELAAAEAARTGEWTWAGSRAQAAGLIGR